MDFAGIPLFQAIARRMAWLNERQATLAQNVANADSPGFSARDLKPLSFADLVGGGGRRLALATTSPNQLSGINAQGGFRSEKEAAIETTLSGNSVNLEGEMMKVAGTTADYQLATDLYRKHLGMIKTAIGRSGG